MTQDNAQLPPPINERPNLGAAVPERPQCPHMCGQHGQRCRWPDGHKDGGKHEHYMVVQVEGMLDKHTERPRIHHVSRNCVWPKN